MNNKDNNRNNDNDQHVPDNNPTEDVHDYKTDEFINDVNKSLRDQVNDELNNSKNADAGVKIDKKIKIEDKADEKKNTRSKLIKYFLIPVALLILLVFVLINTDYGKSLIVRVIGNYSYGKLDYVDSNLNNNNDNSSEQTQTDNNAGENTAVVTPKTITNILLIGVETFEGAENTDTMIVASIDSKNNVIKLTSLMRDLYVEIPDHYNSKLNSVYSKGGISLLYDTIKTNFDIELEGYVLVDFNDFEQVIDYLGGIDIELTAVEANYLRTTNYISKPEYRDVVEGTQHMNGNQVLGYCRIRKVSTATESNDFGRTQRQRIVLERIFEKLRSKNIIQLGLIMNNILSNIDIKTDITKTEYNDYLQQAVYLEKNAIKTFRVPSDGNYTNESYDTGKYNKDVLVPKNWEDTRREIRDFIYGINSD